MREEHSALKTVGGLRVSEANLYTNLLQDIKHRQEDMASDLEDKMRANFMQALNNFSSMEENNTEPIKEEKIKVLSRNNTSDDRIMKLIETLTAKVEKLAIIPRNMNIGVLTEIDQNINPRRGKT